MLDCKLDHPFPIYILNAHLRKPEYEPHLRLPSEGRVVDRGTWLKIGTSPSACVKC
jgi:hypothetical protein